MKRHHWIYIIVSIVSFLVWYRSIAGCTRLSCISSPQLPLFRVKELYQDDKRGYRALLSQGQELLRVEVYYDQLPEKAPRWVDEQSMKIRALYDKAPAPYPGEITDVIICEKEFVPVIEKKRGSSGTEMTVVSNYYITDRMTHGACADDIASYRGYAVLFYCFSHKNVYSLEFIEPKTTSVSAFDQRIERVVSGLLCR